jgi:hypothetical protein
MTWLLPYAIGALLFLAVMLTALRMADLEPPARRRMAFVALRHALFWPIALPYLGFCMVQAGLAMWRERGT